MKGLQHIYTTYIIHFSKSTLASSMLMDPYTVHEGYIPKQLTFFQKKFFSFFFLFFFKTKKKQTNKKIL